MVHGLMYPTRVAFQGAVQVILQCRMDFATGQDDFQPGRLGGCVSGRPYPADNYNLEVGNRNKHPLMMAPVVVVVTLCAVVCFPTTLSGLHLPIFYAKHEGSRGRAQSDG